MTPRPARLTPAPSSTPAPKPVRDRDSTPDSETPVDGLAYTQICLPVGPSANRYWRHVGQRVLLSAPARAYRAEAARIAAAANLPVLSGPVCVRLRVFRARKSGDLDNFLKVTLDAMRGVLYADDKQIVDILAQRFDDAQNPRIELTVWPREILS